MAEWARRPLLGVRRKASTSLGGVTPGAQGLYRTVTVGGSQQDSPYQPPGYQAGNGAARLIYYNTEGVPTLNGATLQARPPTPIPDMRLGNWSFSDTGNWREIKTTATVQGWLKMTNGQADQALTSAVSSREWSWNPGIIMRVRFYGPPLSQARAAYLTVELLLPGVGLGYDAADPNEACFVSLQFPRFTPSDDDPLYGQQWYAKRYWRRSPAAWVGRKIWSDYLQADPDRVFDGMFDAGADQEIQLYVSIIEGKFLLQCPGAGNVVAFPIAQRHLHKVDAGSLRLQVNGGMALFHVMQMEYPTAGGTIEEVAAPSYPPGIVGSGSAVVYVAGNANGAASFTADTASPLKCSLVGTGAQTPVIYSMSERRLPTLYSPTGAEADVGHVKRAEIRLNEAGRGQEAALWFDDFDRSLTDQFTAGVVATVKGEWSAEPPGVDPPLYELFTGRVADRARWEKQPGDERPDPQVVLVDDETLLNASPMGCLNLTGSYAYRRFDQTVKEILNGGGVRDARIHISTITTDGIDATTLRSKTPGGLQFTPETTVISALDTICAARGCIWYLDLNAEVEFAAKPSYSGTPDFTLSDSETDPVLVEYEVAHERQHHLDYANAVMVITERTGVPLTAIATDAALIAADGAYIWHLEQGEYDDPWTLAVHLLREHSGQQETVAWRRRMNYDALILPRMYGTVGIVAGLNLDSGTVLFVQDVTWEIDCETRDAWAHYTARVET